MALFPASQDICFHLNWQACKEIKKVGIYQKAYGNSGRAAEINSSGG